MSGDLVEVGSGCCADVSHKSFLSGLANCRATPVRAKNAVIKLLYFLF